MRWKRFPFDSFSYRPAPFTRAGFSFASISAVCGIFIRSAGGPGIRIREKGGKFHDVPAHHNASDYVDAYLKAAALDGERTPLFRTTRGSSKKLTDKAMSRFDVFRMIRRRALDAGLSAKTCCHTFRATGITAYLSNGSTISRRPQQIAAHESPRTTKLYDRTNDELTLDEVERILI